MARAKCNEDPLMILNEHDYAQFGDPYPREMIHENETEKHAEEVAQPDFERYYKCNHSEKEV